MVPTKIETTPLIDGRLQITIRNGDLYLVFNLDLTDKVHRRHLQDMGWQPPVKEVDEQYKL